MKELDFQALCIAATLPEKPLILWLGAGTSNSSGVPLAGDITWKLNMELPNAIEVAKNEFDDLLTKGASPSLEMLLHVYEKNQGQVATTRFLQHCGIPHRGAVKTLGIGYSLIAHLAKHGALPYIISMNFDEVLEKALDTVLQEHDIGDPTDLKNSYWRAYNDADFDRLYRFMVKNEALPSVTLLKLHGTISDYMSIKATWEKIRQLAEIKQKILLRIFELERQVVFLGYRCVDPDIKRFLEQIYPNSIKNGHNIYWVDYKPLRSLPNASMHLKAFHPSLAMYHRFERATTDDFLIRLVQRISEISRTSSTSTHIIPAATSLSLKYTLGSLTHGTLNQREQLQYEWIIAAALDNGVFNARDLVRRTKALEYAYSTNPESVNLTLKDLTDASVLFKVNRDEYVLGDIIDYVMPKLRKIFRLKRLTKTRKRIIVNYLKDLAQGKVPKALWVMEEKNGIPFFMKPLWFTKLSEMEKKTLQVINGSKELKVVSEYGTWLRRPPFREAILDFLKRRGGMIKAILAEAPPYNSEGYIEWCASVHILSEWGIDICFMERVSHENHMTLGESEAISFKRDRTSYKLKPAFINASTDIEKLERIWGDYSRHSSLTSLLETRPIVIRGDDFEILAVGEFHRKSVIGIWDPEAKRSTTDRIERNIKIAWQKAVKEAERDKRSLFPGQLCRLTEFKQKDGQLKMVFGPTDYREFIGTNRNPKLVRRIDKKYLSNPTAVCVTLLTKDDKILVGRRSQRVMEHPGRWHIPGGHIDPNKHLSENEVDVFAAIIDEIQEETPCSLADVEKVTCLGLVQPKDTLKPELTFFGCISKSKSEIDANARNKEWQYFHFIPNEPRALFNFIIENSQDFVPVGKACLLLYGKRFYGNEWFFETIDQLRRNSV